ncbi:MAG: hypothetical protein JO360_15375 [Acidobacteria bacterium]|nr:hypothetical protein [Acidobacteriota bacterium]
MPGAILTIASTILCMHGGSVILSTSNSKLLIDGVPALVESDVHPVAGCPFTLPGPKYSPCVRVEWTGGAQASAGGQKILVISSIGKCISAEGATQGVAIIANTQMKATLL